MQLAEASDQVKSCNVSRRNTFDIPFVCVLREKKTLLTTQNVQIYYWPAQRTFFSFSVFPVAQTDLCTELFLNFCSLPLLFSVALSFFVSCIPQVFLGISLLLITFSHISSSILKAFNVLPYAFNLDFLGFRWWFAQRMLCVNELPPPSKHTCVWWNIVTLMRIACYVSTVKCVFGRTHVRSHRNVSCRFRSVWRRRRVCFISLSPLLTHLSLLRTQT